MASLRCVLSLYRNASLTSKEVFSCGMRKVSTKASTSRIRTAPLLISAAIAGVSAYGAYKKLNGTFNINLNEVLKAVEQAVPSATVKAAGPPASQPSVYSQGKDHALYLWIYVKSASNFKEVARAIAKLQNYVDQVSDPSTRDEDDEVLAGVGFGPNFYAQIAGKTKENFTYPHRKGRLGEMPSSGGDIFIHAKSNQVSKLFELGQVILRNLPKDSVDSFEDIYSFVYRNGRDLSGFIDGTENPADEDSRREVAVEKATGGSYVITQKWIHDLHLIDTEKDKILEGWVGRSRADSIELNRKSITSHVARMTGGSALSQPKPFQIVRQSMPYGTHSGIAGLFFIGYAASPRNFEYMLDRMVGADVDGHSDDIMRLSKNVKGTYWYFPGVAELKKLE